MKEDAVSPVIAAMLLLAIGVTFFAVWNASYVPSMKAQSEITHIREVESGILRFGSDIETAASLKHNVKFSEQIPLGGGEFTFDAVRSGGSVKITGEDQGYLLLTIVNGTPPITKSSLYRLSNFSYEPVNNFWQNQGYSWRYGSVNVSKGTLTTPLQYASQNDVKYSLGSALFNLDAAPIPDNPDKCQLITIYTANITPDVRHNLSNGNGNGVLMLTGSVTTQQFANTAKMTIQINPGLPEGFRNAIWDGINQQAENLQSCRNIHTTSDNSNMNIQMSFDTIPNMTVKQTITEIVLAAD